MERYFLMVDWCSKGNRGVFCSAAGKAFAKNGSPHTEDEIWEILGAFAMVLAPRSLLLSEDELKTYHRFVSLGEFSDAYGVALKTPSIQPVKELLPPDVVAEAYTPAHEETIQVVDKWDERKLLG